VPGDLVEHETILGTTTRGIPEWRYLMQGREAVVRFNPRLQVNDVGAAIAAARDGFGIARTLSYQVMPDLRSGSLIRLLQDFEPEPWPVSLLLPSTRFMSTRLRTFVDFMMERCSQLDVLRPFPAVRRA
jgi:DNA-binding transcriptional LysR family regulator